VDKYYALAPQRSVDRFWGVWQDLPPSADGAVSDAGAGATGGATLRCIRCTTREFFHKGSSGSQPHQGQVVMGWLSIPRQLKYLAWAMIALAVAFLLLKSVRRK